MIGFFMIGVRLPDELSGRVRSVGGVAVCTIESEILLILSEKIGHNVPIGLVRSVQVCNTYVIALVSSSFCYNIYVHVIVSR